MISSDKIGRVNQMIAAGITLIGLAAAGELACAVLSLMGKWHNPGKQWPIALISGVVFAVAGLLLFLAA